MNEVLLKKWADELYDNIMMFDLPDNLTDSEVYYIVSKVAQKLLVDLTNWHWEDCFPEKYKN